MPVDDAQRTVPCRHAPTETVPRAGFQAHHWALPAEWYERLADARASLAPEDALSLADSVEAAFATGQLEVAPALDAMSTLAKSDVPEGALAPTALYELIGQRLIAGTPAAAAARRFAATLYPSRIGEQAFDAEYCARCQATQASLPRRGRRSSFVRRTTLRHAPRARARRNAVRAGAPRHRASPCRSRSRSPHATETTHCSARSKKRFALRGHCTRDDAAGDRARQPAYAPERVRPSRRPTTCATRNVHCSHNGLRYRRCRCDVAVARAHFDAGGSAAPDRPRRCRMLRPLRSGARQIQAFFAARGGGARGRPRNCQTVEVYSCRTALAGAAQKPLPISAQCDERVRPDLTHDIRPAPSTKCTSTLRRVRSRRSRITRILREAMVTSVFEVRPLCRRTAST